MFDALISSLHTFGIQSEKDIAEFTKRLKPLTIQKKDSLLDLGETCSFMVFVEQGNLIHYYENEEGEEVIVKLWMENDWVVDHQSFTTQSPSKNRIEAYEDCKIWQIGLCDIHEVIGISPSFFALGRILGKASFDPSGRSKKTSPEEKYRSLLQNEPKLLQRFPLKLIASYLGITPETLSRVRQKVVRS
ncbi:Crp/Fnr family transcriptional regulator [Aureisphaera galaxeae]|uniref:Crp/Fnr family transcriptional regulator n=1 Tax=Aureisphaera galaxeae TaxID=1538023 RepID=UPI002350CD08|nr:Crp/Fnr family transcriptional regulator [Aureisphaera galaxeae]MDC8003417.1 Crp/Fnr family transcriptional regulator [Aureisphaera galaxeae]